MLSFSTSPTHTTGGEAVDDGLWVQHFATDMLTYMMLCRKCACCPEVCRSAVLAAPEATTYPPSKLIVDLCTVFCLHSYAGSVDGVDSYTSTAADVGCLQPLKLRVYTNQAQLLFIILLTDCWSAEKVGLAFRHLQADLADLSVAAWPAGSWHRVGCPYSTDPSSSASCWMVMPPSASAACRRSWHWTAADKAQADR